MLETTLRRISQHTGRKRLSEAHSPPGDRIGRDKSARRNKVTELGALTNWRSHWGDKSAHKKEVTEQGALTN